MKVRSRWLFFLLLLLLPKSGFSSGSALQNEGTWCQSFVFCKCFTELSQVVWSKTLLKVSLWQHLWPWNDDLQQLHHFNHTVLLFQWSWTTVLEFVSLYMIRSAVPRTTTDLKGILWHTVLFTFSLEVGWKQSNVHFVKIYQMRCNSF